MKKLSKINEIEKGNKSYTLFHNCDTGQGSSGSPIILYNHKVIGVHRGYAPEKNIIELLSYNIQLKNIIGS